MTCGGSVVFSRNSAFLHDITEKLLKVALNTIIKTFHETTFSKFNNWSVFILSLNGMRDIIFLNMHNYKKKKKCPVWNVIILCNQKIVVKNVETGSTDLNSDFILLESDAVREASDMTNTYSFKYRFCLFNN